MRSLLAMILICSMPAEAGAQDVSGSWAGTYTCNQGLTAIALDVVPVGVGFTALAHFFADPSNPRVPEGCFALQGAAGADRRVMFSATHWILQPAGYVTVDLDGTLSSDGRTLSGRVIGPNCTGFRLRRMKAPGHMSRVCGAEALAAEHVGQQ